MTESAVNVLQILSLQVQHQSHCFQMLSTTSNLLLLNMLKEESKSNDIKDKDWKIKMIPRRIEAQSLMISKTRAEKQ